MRETNEKAVLSIEEGGVCIPEPWTWGRGKSDFDTAWAQVEEEEKRAHREIDDLCQEANAHLKGQGIQWIPPSQLAFKRMEIHVLNNKERDAGSTSTPQPSAPVLQTFCFSCGFSVPLGNAFCGSCGEKSYLCAACHSPKPNAESFCGRCGAKK
jgi:hypothetical protein